MRPFLVGLQFLTRLHIVTQTEWALEDFGRSTRYFPLIGLVLGICYAIIAYGLMLVLGDTGKFTLAAILTILPILFTGGLHADGFMDTADGIFSGRERERVLEIMKDSRVGSFGVVAFVVLTLVQLSILLDIDRDLYLPALLIMPVIGRMAMVISICLFPYPRNDGIGKIFSDMGDSKTLIISSITTLVITLLVGIYALLSLLVGVIFAFFFCRYVTNIIGGTTGDIYGAVTVLTETLVLMVYLIAPQYILGYVGCDMVWIW